MKITKDTKIKAVLNSDGDFPVIEILGDDGEVLGSSVDRFRGMEAADERLVQATRWINFGLDGNRTEILFTDKGSGSAVWYSKYDFAKDACMCALQNVRMFEDSGKLPSGTLEAVAAVASCIPYVSDEELRKAA